MAAPWKPGTLVPPPPVPARSVLVPPTPVQGRWGVKL